eukprot:gene14235-21568_t
MPKMRKVHLSHFPTKEIIRLKVYVNESIEGSEVENKDKSGGLFQKCFESLKLRDLSGGGRLLGETEKLRHQ